MFKQLHINISLADALILIPKYQKMLKSLLSNNEKLIELANTLLNENCSAVILKKLPEKLGNPRKFLIPCGFSELKCKALADLGASINLMPLPVWKEDVFVPVGKFTFPADFVIVDYESDPRVPLILGRPFLWTAHALIDVYGEEMILCDGNERLILNMKNNTSSYSNEPHQESINMIDVYDVSHEELLKDLFATNHPSGNPTSSLTSHTDLTSPEVINISSGNPTSILEPEIKSSSSPILISLEESDLIWEEFEAYLASDSFPPGNSDPSSLLPPFHNSLSGSTTSSSPSLHIFETSDYFLKEFQKIKESKLLIDELDLPESNNVLPFLECDSVFYEVDALPSTNNEDKVFNPGILIHENLFEVTNFATPDKNVKKATNASLILGDFNSPLYELPFHKEVPGLGALLSFSSKNEEKVFNPGILTSKRVHTSLLPELSHRGTKAFKVTKILESPMEIFPCSHQEDIRVLDVPDPCVPLILGRPFLRTARALIDVHGEEMILRDGNERLILNMRNDTSSYSNEPHQELINMIDIYNVSHEEIREDLFATNHLSGNPISYSDLTSPEVNDDIFDPKEDIIENLPNLDKTKDLPLYHDNQSSGNPTLISEPETKSSSSSPTLISLEESELIWEEFEAYLISDYFLEEFADELAHITFPPGNDDLPFDAESDLRELEYLLNHDMDSILKDSVDENFPNDNLDDTISEMFTDEHALDYSSPPLWDDYDDNIFDHESDNDNVYDDPFDFKEEKIKESKLLIDELDLPESNNVLPFLECDSVFYEDFSEVDALPSTNNEDKVFNPGILIHENLFEVTNFATPDKNVKKTTNASLILEDFNPPLYELPFHKEVPGLGALLSFSSENEEKVFNPGILTSKRVHTSLLPELSHRGTKAFKVTKILESPMEIFPCSYQEDIRVLDVPCLHFYPP
ncbi:hypothetical protein Tco_0464038 [Tanacetum coccineum]